KYGRCEQMIDRNTEKTLNLRRVQIHCQESVRAGSHKKVRNDLGGNRNTGLVFPVLTGIAKIRNYGSDALCRSPLEGIDHQEELHQVGVHRRPGRLDNKNVCTPDILE